MAAVENVSDGKGTATMSTAEEGGDAKGVSMITLISSDNESFEVSEAAASMSETISNMIEDGCAEGGIPLPNVSASILGKVLEYCNKHAAAAAAAVSSEAAGSSSDAAAASSSNDAASSSSSAAATAGKEQEDVKSFDKEFIDVEMEVLFEILLASNYLNVKKLLGLASQTIADRIKDKSPEEIRTIFGIENDFDPEKEERIRSENSWAFEK